MRTAVALVAVFFFTLQTSFAAAVTGERVPDRNSYSARNYKHSLIGKRSAARIGASATWGEILNHPHEWGRGLSGFGKRLASGAATHVVATSIEYGVGHMLHEERSKQLSADPHFKARFKSALGNTFLVYHRGSTKRGPAVGRISGAVGAGLISRAWQPASAATIGAGFASAGVALGADFGVNLAREYWPRKHHEVTQAHRHRVG